MESVTNAGPDVLPVRKSIVVNRTPQTAFEIFTGRIGSWWPLGKFSVFEERAVNCMVEPRVGGRVYEISTTGEESLWGRIQTWEPPHRFAMTWHPGENAEARTVVEVTFAPVADGTRVVLEHRDWHRLGDRAKEARAGYDTGWTYVFERCFGGECA